MVLKFCHQKTETNTIWNMDYYLMLSVVPEGDPPEGEGNTLYIWTVKLFCCFL